MISLHAPENNPGSLAHDWFFPFGASPCEWLDGQTEPDHASLERLAEIMIHNPWSPSRFAHGHRHEDNFLSASVVALDFDEDRTIVWALEKFKRLKHIITTTKSHGIPKGKKNACDRFRVVLFLEYPYTYLPIYKNMLAEYINITGADRQVKDGARFFWPSKEIISIREGFFCPELRLKKQAPEKKMPAHSPKNRTSEATTLPPRDCHYNTIDPFKKAGCRAWLAGAGYNLGKRNISCYQAAGDFAESNYSYDDAISWIRKVGSSLEDWEIVSTVSSAFRKKRGS